MVKGGGVLPVLELGGSAGPLPQTLRAPSAIPA